MNNLFRVAMFFWFIDTTWAQEVKWEDVVVIPTYSKNWDKNPSFTTKKCGGEEVRLLKSRRALVVRACQNALIEYLEYQEVEGKDDD